MFHLMCLTVSSLFPNEVFFKPYCIRIANKQTCHRLKLLLPSNFSISNHVVELEVITKRSRENKINK
ncbi:hypothetical protein EUGRSUZ_G00174 [Eucalyptus grandis]|uniref:Uncharacterized protein n=2 Tax=Eucalyptus grandis TaxID=71139 RepID=A0ACC3K0Z8_EUCGR|nr:hypothetical protein EUGRSUZ_G00174 [Eucalyptus grandis]